MDVTSQKSILYILIYYLQVLLYLLIFTGTVPVSFKWTGCSPYFKILRYIYTLVMKTEKFSCADLDHLKAILVPVPTYLCKNSLILIRVADPDPVGPGRVHIFLLHPDQIQIQFFYFVLLIRVSKKPFRPYRYTNLSLN